MAAIRGKWQLLAAHTAALAGFAAIAAAYTWPLAARFFTHFPGVQMEAFNNFWNAWHHALISRDPTASFFWTDHQYWPYGTNLILVHYTAFNNVAMSFLEPLLGFQGAYNALFLSAIVLSGYGLFLAMRQWGADLDVSFIAAGAFAFSPVLARQLVTGRGVDYSSFHSVAFFLWALTRLIKSGKLSDAVLTAVFLTWTWFYNYYYFLACMVALPVAYAAHHGLFGGEIRRRPFSRKTRAISAASAAAVVGAGIWAAAVLSRGQIEFRGSGRIVDILRYMAPYHAFWLSVALWLLTRYRFSLRLNPGALRCREWGRYAAVVACWAAMNWPLILTTLYFMSSGHYGAPANRWRGGGNPADLGYAFLPNPYHPLWGSALSELFGYPHNNNIVFGLTPLLAIAWLWKQQPRDPLTRTWLACFAAFFILGLGPWLKLFGVHAYLPLPFYLLHALPVFINMPAGSNFEVMPMGLAALLLGVALQRAKARLNPRWARPAMVAALCLVGFEYAFSSIKLFRPEFPGIIYRLRERPDGALLHVPVWSNFHFIVNPGPIGREFMDHVTAQRFHEKPMVGGHLGRVPRRLYELAMGDPIFRGLLEAQEGAKPNPLLSDRRIVSRYLRDMRLRYVLVDESKLPQAVIDLLARWPLRPLDAEGSLKLYEVIRPSRS